MLKNTLAALAVIVLCRPTLVAADDSTTVVPAPYTKKSDAPAPMTQTVAMTLIDLQVAIVSVSNAGAACDIGVRQFCQVLPVRDATIAKLQAAITALQTPAPVK